MLEKESELRNDFVCEENTTTLSLNQNMSDYSDVLERNRTRARREREGLF